MGLGWGHFRVQGPPGRSQDLDSPNCWGTERSRTGSGRRLAIDKCSVFNELPWNSRQCFWVGSTVGHVRLARELGKETPRRVCLTYTERWTSLLATALGSVLREASVLAACVFGGCAVSLRQPSWVKMLPRPQNHPTTLDAHVNHTSMTFLQIPISWSAWFCLWRYSKSSLLFGSRGMLNYLNTSLEMEHRWGFWNIAADPILRDWQHFSSPSSRPPAYRWVTTVVWHLSFSTGHLFFNSV